jgi:hypothetical protein
MSELGFLGATEAVEDGRFGCRGLASDARHHEQYVLTWFLPRGYWTCFGEKEKTHNFFQLQMVGICSLCHLLSKSTPGKVFGSQTNLVIEYCLSQFFEDLLRA